MIVESKQKLSCTEGINLYVDNEHRYTYDHEITRNRHAKIGRLDRESNLGPSACRALCRDVLCSVMISMSARQAEGPRFDFRSRPPIFVCSVACYFILCIIRCT